jgi:hypothetical protein
MLMDDLMFLLILGGMTLTGVAFVAEYRSRQTARTTARLVASMFNKARASRAA